MFGITKSELNGDDGKARLKAIRDAYVKVINALKTGQGMPLTDSFLVCGDTSLTRTTNMADLGPLGAPEQDFTAMYGANGVWYASQPRTPGSDTVRVIFTTLPTFSPPICFDTRAGNAGQTVAGQTFHPRALRTDPNEEILRDAMDQNVRKIDKGKDASEGITLNPDLIKNRGGVLLHEMFHMIDTDVPNEYKYDYTRILDSLNDGTDMPADKNYILCGTDLTFTRNLRDIGQVDGSDSDFQSLYGAGVWYAKSSKNKNGVPQVIFTGRPPQSPDPQKPGVGHGICIDPVTQKKVVAQTFQPSSPEIANEAIDLGIYKIVLCDAIWDLREDIIADFGKDAGERTPGTSANADDVANRGGYLLHEMFHLLDRSTASTKKDWRDKDTKIRDQETPDAYKMTGTISLTKTGDWQRISTNPDNYRVFADMAWWSKTRWRGLTPAGQSKRPAEDVSEDDLFESPSDESDSDSTDG
ncbi:hypothetical protein CkaCkLH20_08247 [Colletotrichum karsti]|uniref:Lysine-specific metallo-endopeptidase domain-containing protein n=1 Tax=Colletotrichum karsti TaxID=1095194 RepID=A0A9P6I0Z8_9PEZI|nr:uncharacterized protein CkaCkLH20_08247 [Colletotrichum karsti]KAF9874264.1 hypothetical protein CkaCkLH20_08247 [Colletotrichum karsti]